MLKYNKILTLLLLASIWGCSSANDKSIILDASGKHPAGWAVATTGGLHPAVFRANQSACVECHGSATDPITSGGISGVSCFSSSRSGIVCHPDGPSGHPVGWNVPGSHGAAAKAVRGFIYCTECHGTPFSGGIAISCFRCHTTAPHPAAPWRGTTASGTTHTSTNETNAPECAHCHMNGQRLAVPQSVPIGAAPGCFNNTLCHGATHPAGWNLPANHGATAKAPPDPSHGFSYCIQCHNSNYVGGPAKSCKACHTSAPHPAAPWRGTTASGTTHTTTNEANAPECSRCHAGGAKLATPGNILTGATCFNNTLCHGAGHPAGWNLPASHGAAAKVAPDASHGFSYCIQCHNSNYVAGPAKSCKACHTSAPHPAAPWRGTTASGTTHTNTNEANVLECSRCHAGGAKLSTPGNIMTGATCFNNTLCHGTKTSHSFPYPGSLHKSSTVGCSSCHILGTSASSYPAAANRPPDCKSCHRLSTAASIAQMSGCSDCHGDPATGRPNGTVFPNIDKRHSSPSEHKVACTTCHAGGGTGTASHGNSNNSVKTFANVILNGTASGMNIVRSSSTGRITCTGACHGESHNGSTW